MNILFPYMARWKSINWTRYHNLLSEFAKRGHKIYIIQPPSLKSEETNFLDIEIEIDKNITLITFSDIPFWDVNLPFSKVIKKGVYTYLLSRKINFYIKKFNIDIVLIYNIPQYLIAKNLKGKTRLILDICDDYPEMLGYELKIFKNLVKIIGKFLLKKLIKLSNVVITTSNGLKEKYFNFAYLIPNGVDSNMKYDFQLEKLNKSKNIIGFVGSFEYFVDFDLIYYLAKNLENFEFVLIGMGRLFKRVMEYINKNKIVNIKLIGPVEHNKLSKYLRNFDIALLSFKKNEITDNSCPLKIFEYALFKIPIVSADLNELRKIGSYFINFYKTKEEALNLIVDIINNKDNYKNKCEIGYKLVINEYNWNSIAENYLKIISEQLNLK